MKKWDDRSRFDKEIVDLVTKTINEIYDKVKYLPNVLSGEEVYKLYDKINFFSATNEWKDEFLLKPQNRDINNRVIFGLKSGVYFTASEIFFVKEKNKNSSFSFALIEIAKMLKFENKLIIHHFQGRNFKLTYKKHSTNEDIAILQDIISIFNKIQYEFDEQVAMNFDNQKQQKEIELAKLKNNIENTLLNFKLDKSGILDLNDNEFFDLFTKNQKIVSDIDKNYIHKFVKISNYIKLKKANTQNIFESIKIIDNQEELQSIIGLLRNQIHSYELLIFHSINMIGALVSQDLITFYEIYESFDKLEIFNSDWENKVSKKLSKIEDKLDDLMYSIHKMEQNIILELGNLNYTNQKSYEKLNESVTEQLEEIGSSLKINNLLNGLQTYQLYKINKNTKTFLG
jgi:hypothetical protein